MAWNQIISISGHPAVNAVTQPRYAGQKQHRPQRPQQWQPTGYPAESPETPVRMLAVRSEDVHFVEQHGRIEGQRRRREMGDIARVVVTQPPPPVEPLQDRDRFLAEGALAIVKDCGNTGMCDRCHSVHSFHLHYCTVETGRLMYEFPSTTGKY